MRSDATIIIAALTGGRKKHLEQAYDQLLNAGANVIGVIETKVPENEYKSYLKDYDYFKKLPLKLGKK